jgi:hypothetical protein
VVAAACGGCFLSSTGRSLPGGRHLGWCSSCRGGRWRRRLRLCIPCRRCVGCNLGVAALDTSDRCTSGTSDTGGDATAAAYEPFGDSSDSFAASALRVAIVEELAMIATPVLRVRVGIETCKFSTCTKTWVYLGPGPSRESCTCSASRCDCSCTCYLLCAMLWARSAALRCCGCCSVPQLQRPSPPQRPPALPGSVHPALQEEVSSMC